MSQKPKAFMSYVNLDDQHENGLITQFREHLSRAVRMQTGEAFDIFQDRKDIVWGQPWEKRIHDSLAATTFLIPIITPSFFNSAPCRDELELFLKREEELQRGDLILPVYYVSCPVLSNKANKLAQAIAARQYADWRELRFEDFASPQCRRAFAKLAEQIAAALERSEADSSRAEVVRRADATKKESTASNSGSTFANTGSGGQSIAQGDNAIGTQINHYYAPSLQHTTPLPEQPTLIVDQRNRGDYATITDALKAAKTGTRIIVKPGLYKEGITIDKPVEIIGHEKQEEIIIEAFGENTVLFQADTGRVANLTLRQTYGEWYHIDWCCVDITQGRLVLEDCDIYSQSSMCVVIHSSANPRLYRNRIHDGEYNGVVVCKNGKGTLKNNEIFNNKFSGVTIMTGGASILHRNRIYHNGLEGVRVLSGGGGIFEDNDLLGNAKGAWLIDPDCEAHVQRRRNKE